jgi:hypothetical protein
MRNSTTAWIQTVARIVQLLVVFGISAIPPAVFAADYNWRLGVEAGPVWQSRNDVQIPGDTGTRFSLVDLAGSGPFPYVRLELVYQLAEKHGLRFLLAPFEYTETGQLDTDVSFAGQSFSAGQATEATYQFNSYRVTYRYRFFSNDRWEWHVGGTLKVRDAEIKLSQGSVTARDTDTGVVPLLNLYGEYSPGKDWSLIFDLDGLASSQGRAIDLGLLARYDLSEAWYLAGGYRTLEGGADNDSVYNFAWFNYAVLSAGYRF